MNEEARIASVIANHRKIIRRVIWKISIYYVLVSVLLIAALSVFPGIVEHLPLGGVGNIGYFATDASSNLEEALLSADDEQVEIIATEAQRVRLEAAPRWLRNLISLLIAMLSTLVLMLPVGWVYKSIHADSVYDHSLDTTTLVLPAVVAGIVTMVQHSLALAFSLAGIVAGVRFRRALSDTFDTLFILASIGVGIAAGIKSIEIAVVLTVFFSYSAALVCAFGDGLESQHEVQRKIRRSNRKAERKRAAAMRADPNAGPRSGL